MIAFLVRKVLSILVTLVAVTAILYGIAMLTPPETRATLFMPKSKKSTMTEEQYQRKIAELIETHGLDKPFLGQYTHWVGQLLRGDLGFSPTIHSFVLDALVTRAPATAELILYSLLVFIPSGVVSGLLAGYHQKRPLDRTIRAAAYAATTLPPFVLALVLLSIFWVGLKWFSIGRLEVMTGIEVRSAGFHLYTGLLTIDGLLNGRPDISLDALKHLVLPVITTSLVHWATLTRITRATTIEELNKEYILAARGRGVPENRLVWKHAFPNVFVPALNASALSAATLVTSLYIVEKIFLFNGISSMINYALGTVPDIALALGFALFSVILVLVIMSVLDVAQVLADPLQRADGGRTL